MTLASTSKVQIAYIEEVTPGTTPASGTPVAIRTTGESLQYSVQNESSKEINDTRQVSDRIPVGASVSGGLNLEFNYRGYDAFMEALIGGTFNTFGTDGVKSLTTSSLASGNTITDDGTDGFAGLVAGQWIRVASTLNTGICRIASMASNDQITIDSDTLTLVDAPAASMTVSSCRLSCGTAALRYFSIEKQFSDVTQFFIFRGLSPSKLSLSFAAGSLLTGTLDFMGFSSARGSSTLLPGAPSSAQDFGIMNAITGLGSLLIDGSPLSGTYIKSMNVNIDAKLRGQTAVGYLGNVGLGSGTFEIGGTLEFYLADGALYDTAVANGSVSIEWPVSDVDGNGYAFVFNNVKLDVPTVTAGSMDSDVMLSVPFTAIAPDTTTDKMIIIDRFGAAAV